MQSMRNTCQAGTNEDRRSAVSSQELIFWGNWRNFDRTRITGRYIKIVVSSRSVVAVSIKQLVNRQKDSRIWWNLGYGCFGAIHLDTPALLIIIMREVLSKFNLMVYDSISLFDWSMRRLHHPERWFFKGSGFPIPLYPFRSISCNSWLMRFKVFLSWLCQQIVFSSIILSDFTHHSPRLIRVVSLSQFLGQRLLLQVALIFLTIKWISTNLKWNFILPDFSNSHPYKSLHS